MKVFLFSMLFATAALAGRVWDCALGARGLAPPYIRELKDKDLPSVLQIENAHNADGSWNEAGFWRVLGKRNCIGMLAEAPAGKPQGFLIYEVSGFSLELRNFGVDPAAYGNGIGQALINKLKKTLAKHRCTEISVNVPVDDLASLKFLREQDFNTKEIVKDQAGLRYVRMVFRDPNAPELLSVGPIHVRDGFVQAGGELPRQLSPAQLDQLMLQFQRDRR